MFAAADEASTFVGHGKQPRLFSQWRTRGPNLPTQTGKRTKVANARHKSPNEHPFFPEHLLELVVPSV
uniref:Uncharacterized protein n=1 Tax=Oryza punctata TaxID=4537 RepID=A0A0E0M0Y9_ORYPU